MREDDLAWVMAVSAQLAEAPHWSEETWLRALAAPDETDGVRRTALLAEVAGARVGFALASVVGPTVELESIGVAPDWQRRGVGSQLLADLVARLQAEPIEELVLEVRASNAAAQGLYARAGFATAGRRRNYYRDPVEDALVMRLAL
jgi:ribosomal-protein-alanine N-acetyltransferase